MDVVMIVYKYTNQTNEYKHLNQLKKNECKDILQTLKEFLCYFKNALGKKLSSLGLLVRQNKCMLR